MSQEKNIAARFDLGGNILDIRAYGHGLINDTFIVSLDSGRKAILQRLNSHVFARPDLIMKNLQTFMNHVQQHPCPLSPSGRELRLAEILITRDGKYLVNDDKNEAWRALGFIENTCSFDTIADIAQAEEVGFALGRFHTLAHELDPSLLHETLPGFHNTAGYFKKFKQAAAASNSVSDNLELNQYLSFAFEREELVQTLETAKIKGLLKPRAIHGDTKLNNFLFDVHTKRAVSLIDLDTVQAGLIHYDIGDCLRSCANRAGESPKNIADVYFDLDICRALLKSYLAETKNFMTKHDFYYLYEAIRLIPFELGLRFLTDHLQNDHYFKIEWPGQNLHRARVQFHLTASIEKLENQIKTYITELASSV